MLRLARKWIVSSSSYTFGPYVLTRAGRVLLRNGEPVSATPKVLATLLVLLRANGQALSKEDLLQAVWPDSFVEEGNLTQTISVLRKLLAPDYPDGSPIETIPRMGYRFCAPVEIAEEPPQVFLPVSWPSTALTEKQSAPFRIASLPDLARVAQPNNGTASAPGAPRSTGQIQGLRGKRLAAFALAVGIVAVTALLVTLHRSRVSAKAAATLKPRIAVLAFKNLSRSADTVWIADALRETLTTELGSDRTLRVLPSEAVERAEREMNIVPTTDLGPDKLQQVCQNLDCDVVVSGSYLVTGDRIRLDARLLAARDGAVLGTFNATESTNGLLALIDQAGAYMRMSFGLRTSSANREAVRASVSKDPEAYRLYIEGLEQVRAFDGRAAVDLLERSAKLDPNFPLVHEELANAYTILGQEERAVTEAHKAEALDGNLSRQDQLQIEAGARRAERRFTEAAELYQTLFTMYPEELKYGWLMAAELSYAGHPQQCIDVLRSIEAQGTPAAHDPRMYSTMADCYGLMGDWPASLASATKGAEESKRRGAKVLYGRLLTSRTQALMYMKQLQPALVETQEAVSIARAFHDYSGELRALNRLGQIETAMGNLTQAQVFLQEALAREDQLGETERQIHTLAALGRNLEQQGKYAEAAVSFQRGLDVARDYGQPIFVVEAQLNVGRLQVRQGKLREGREMLRLVASRAAGLNNQQLVAEAMHPF